MTPGRRTSRRWQQQRLPSRSQSGLCRCWWPRLCYPQAAGGAQAARGGRSHLPSLQRCPCRSRPPTRGLGEGPGVLWLSVCRAARRCSACLLEVVCIPPTACLARKCFSDPAANPHPPACPSAAPRPSTAPMAGPRAAARHFSPSFPTLEPPASRCRRCLLDLRQMRLRPRRVKALQAAHQPGPQRL